MNHFTVPKWNQRQQRQEQLAAEEQGNTSCDHVPKSGYEVAELTWENGQLAMHDLSRKWAGDTLECIVDQATRDRPNQNPVENLNSLAAPWDGKQSKKSSRNIVASSSGNERTLVKKRTRAESEQNGSACASASATFCRDNTDTTMMTWTSFEPPQSFKSARVGDDDSSLHTCSEKQDEQGGSKSDDGTGSRSSKRHSRAADKHNQSERRRRDRINQKMKALQKLVPNANKSDKASMLDEVIAYLKQLQAQVQMMSASARTMMMMPQSRTMMMMPQSQPLLTQQHLQMSLLARLGMGMGMGMNNIAHHQSIPSYLHSPFVAPPNRPSLPFNDPYCTFLAQQSMNMDFYNKMEALYQQRINKSLQEQVSSTLTNNVQQGG